MPGEVLDRPNPPPGKSQLPDSILEYHVDLDYANTLTPKELQAITKFRRAADYIAAAMIFLKDNVLLGREIKAEDIKPRLLGHWGTCPGLVLTYAHLNMLIRKENQKMIFVVGPGMSLPLSPDAPFRVANYPYQGMAHLLSWLLSGSKAPSQSSSLSTVSTKSVSGI